MQCQPAQTLYLYSQRTAKHTAYTQKQPPQCTPINQQGRNTPQQTRTNHSLSRTCTCPGPAVLPNRPHLSATHADRARPQHLTHLGLCCSQPSTVACCPACRPGCSAPLLLLTAFHSRHQHAVCCPAAVQAADQPCCCCSQPLEDVLNLQQLAEGLHDCGVVPVLGYGTGVNTHLLQCCVYCWVVELRLDLW